MVYSLLQLDYMPGVGADRALSALSAVRRGDSLQPDDRAGGHQRVAGAKSNLYDFWFYITNFSRYPMEIYRGPDRHPLRRVFTFVIPMLVVVNVPARLLAKPLDEPESGRWPVSPWWRPSARWSVSRWMFQQAMLSYRSASS